MAHDTNHGSCPTTVSREIPRNIEDLVRMGLLITKRMPAPCTVRPSKRFTVEAEFRGLTALEAYRRRGVDGDAGDPRDAETGASGFVHFGVRPTFINKIERELYEREDVAYSHGALVVEREAKPPYWTQPIELRRAVGCSHPNAQRLVKVHEAVRPDYNTVSTFVRGFRKLNRSGQLSVFERKMRGLEDIAWDLWAEEPHPDDALHRAVSVYEPDRIGEGDQVPEKLRDEPTMTFRKTTWVPWERAAEDEEKVTWRVRSKLGRQFERRIAQADVTELADKASALRRDLKSANGQLPDRERRYLWSHLYARKSELVPIGRVHRVLTWLRSAADTRTARARRQRLLHAINAGELERLAKGKAEEELRIRLCHTAKHVLREREAGEAAEEAAAQVWVTATVPGYTKEAKIQAVNAALRKGVSWSSINKMFPAGAFA